MNNLKTVAIVVAAGVILGLLSSVSSLLLAPAQAKSNPILVEKYTTSGKLAVAQWFSVDGDTFTDGSVNLVDLAKISDGDPISFVDVYIQQYQLEEHCETINVQTICNYEYVDLLGFFGSAEVGVSDFRISNNVKSASLNSVEVTGYDYVSNSEMTITVDATWTDSGSVLKQKNSFSETNEDYKVFFKGMANGRAADASVDISGDINVDNGNNSDYSDAFILKARDSVIYRIYEEPIF